MEQTTQTDTVENPGEAFKFNFRKVAGILFTSGSTTFALTHLNKIQSWETLASALFISAGVFYAQTKEKPHHLCTAAVCVIGAQSILISQASGDGQTAQNIGSVLAIAQSLLQIRTGYREVYNKPPITAPKLLKIFEYADRYPYVAGTILQGPGCFATAYGAFDSGKWKLGISAIQWTLANGFNLISDPHIKKITTALQKKITSALSTAKNSPAPDNE